MATPVDGQWSTDSSSRLTVEINLPAFRLDARLDTVTLASFPIAVGMRQYQTPTGDFTITEVQWNPWWNPPDSWWARNDSVTPPGPRNPMGKVKMPLGSTKLYLHGTSQPQSIGKAASHACLRMRNDDAVALASLLQVHGGAAVTQAAMDAILRQWKTTVRVPLPLPVTVRIAYRLVELRGDELVFHPDIYRRGSEGVEDEALVMLAATGLDTTAVDRDLLHRVASEATRSPSSVKISRLVMPGVRNLPTTPADRPDSRANPGRISSECGPTRGDYESARHHALEPDRRDA